MSGGFDQRSETEGVIWLTGMQTDTDVFFFFNFKSILVLLMSTVTVASNLIFPPPNIGWQSVFFPSSWLLFDLLKGTSYVSQGPAI